MIVRKGFISNSSSTSFIILFDEKPTAEYLNSHLNIDEKILDELNSYAYELNSYAEIAEPDSIKPILKEDIINFFLKAFDYYESVNPREIERLLKDELPYVDNSERDLGSWEYILELYKTASNVLNQLKRNESLVKYITAGNESGICDYFWEFYKLEQKGPNPSDKYLRLYFISNYIRNLMPKILKDIAFVPIGG